MTSHHLNRRLIGIVAATVLALGATAAQSQTAPTPPAAVPPPPAAAAPPARPGFIDVVGQMIEQSVAKMGTTFGKMNESTTQGASDAASAAAAATKKAADGLVALPMSRMIVGREVCGVARNGAPDCDGAVAKICRANGLATGRSMDVETVEVCPPATLLARRYGQPEPEPCKLENTVTKVLCQ